MRAEEGNTVRVHYTGRFTDGEIFDSSLDREPLEFQIGSGQVIKGFETGVVGMDVGDKKTVNIAPADAYGEYNEYLNFKIPNEHIPENLDAEEGMHLQLANENQDVIQVVVKEIQDDAIIVDANHPLAGKELVFEIDLVEIL